MDANRERVQAAKFYVDDLEEEMKKTKVSSTSKKDLEAQLRVWNNTIRLAKSFLDEIN